MSAQMTESTRLSMALATLTPNVITLPTWLAMLRFNLYVSVSPLSLNAPRSKPRMLLLALTLSALASPEGGDIVIEASKKSLNTDPKTSSVTNLYSNVAKSNPGGTTKLSAGMVATLAWVLAHKSGTPQIAGGVELRALTTRGNVVFLLLGIVVGAGLGHYSNQL